MAKRNELPALIISLLVTAGLLAGGAWWLREKFFSGGNNVAPTATLSGGQRGSANITGADGSLGQSLLPGTPSTAKQKGLDALAAGDYAAAQVEFTAALQENRNDPESLIYLNNAKIGEDAAYTIAVVMPVGPALNPTLEVWRGVAQAQQEINELGGINGTPLRVLLLNDEGKPDTATAIATALVNNPDVLGVVGHYSSDVSLAAAEVYESGQLPMVSPTSTAVKIADAGEYIFRTVPSDRLAAATLSRHVREQLKEQKAVVFYDSQSAYSRSVKQEFTTELLSSGGQVVKDFDVKDSGFSASRSLQEAKQAGAEVIMLALTTDTLDTAAFQIIAVNDSELPLVGSDDLYNIKVLDTGSDALGLTVAVPWHILSHEQSGFVSSSRALWGGDVSWRTVTAYDAVQALISGLSVEPTRRGIVETIGESGFSTEGATDTIGFFPSGDRNQPSQLVEVAEGNRSGTGFDYVPVK